MTELIDIVEGQLFDSAFDCLLLMLVMAFLPGRRGRLGGRIGILALVMVLSALVRGLEIPLFLDMLVRMAVLYLFLRLLKEISPRMAFYYITLFYLIIELCNTVNLFACNYIFVSETFLTRFPQGAASGGFLRAIKILAVLPLRFLVRRQEGRKPEKSQIFFLAFPFVLFLYLRNLNHSLWAGNLEMIWAIGILATISSVVCYGMVLLSDAQIAYIQNRNELRRMALLLNQEKRYYEERAQNSEEIRKLAHDMKNHLRTIRKLSRDPEVKDYVASIIGEIANHEMLYQTGNEALDIILNDKFQICRQKAVRLTPYLDAGGLDFIRPVDLSVIFGNLLDNAIEAVEKIEEEERREIRLKIGHKGNFFVIRLENPFAEAPLRIRGNLFQTGKQEEKFHGFGLGNVEQVVESYSGQMNIDLENGVFQVTILLPGPFDSYPPKPAS
ncbi:MAG: GHKL domain-containing protein [Lachnospiraceae bacterium]|nr:GHKL domain-containing protein [Lachnospiraceae bacterium]